jgi:hypothetical protein
MKEMNIAEPLNSVYHQVMILTKELNNLAIDKSKFRFEPSADELKYLLEYKDKFPMNVKVHGKEVVLRVSAHFDRWFEDTKRKEIQSAIKELYEVTFKGMIEKLSRQDKDILLDAISDESTTSILQSVLIDSINK